MVIYATTNSVNTIDMSISLGNILHIYSIKIVLVVMNIPTKVNTPRTNCDRDQQSIALLKNLTVKVIEQYDLVTMLQLIRFAQCCFLE